MEDVEEALKDTGEAVEDIRGVVEDVRGVVENMTEGENEERKNEIYLLLVVLICGIHSTKC